MRTDLEGYEGAMIFYLANSTQDMFSFLQNWQRTVAGCWVP